MELWIRSQDRKRLIKVYDLVLNKYTDCCVIKCNGRNDNILGRYDNILGEYDTEERALEVLDEIQNILEHEWDYKDKFSMCRVYEMPRE